MYSDGRSRCYVKVFIERYPISDRVEEITRRGCNSAGEAGKARRELLANVNRV